MKKIFTLAVILGIAFSANLMIGKPQANASATISPGDLIRGETFNAVYYYGEDGFRYVFPNSKTYFTWYENFDDVKFISDAQLGEITIGGNVRYRPGSQLVKVTTNPQTYAVDDQGVLRHVSSEEVAVGLYGSNWNKRIDDVPDAFFTNYTIGDPIYSASEFNPAQKLSGMTSINDNRGLIAPATMSITDSAYSPVSVTIEPGQTVQFTNAGTENHTITSDDYSWGSGTMMPGKKYTFRFEEAGTYTFFDSYNSQATGAVIVE